MEEVTLKPEESTMDFDFDFLPMSGEDGSPSGGASKLQLHEGSNTNVVPSMYGFRLDIPGGLLDSEGDILFPDEALDDELIQQNIRSVGPLLLCSKHAYTKLEITKRRLSNIKRLNEYIYLRNINLAENRIKDLSPLAAIPLLQVLNVAGNRISDVSEFPMFPFLQALNLARNDISTTMGFQPNRLVYLNLSKNRLSALEDIRGDIFPNLLVLELRGNMLMSLEGLSSLPKLEELYVAENQLLDMKGLENCSTLKTLHLRRNKVSSLMDFSGLPNLEYLNVRSNQISDFSELQQLSTAVKLSTVIVSENPVAEEDERYRPEVIAASPPTLRRVDKFLLSETEQAVAFRMRSRRSKGKEEEDGGSGLNSRRSSHQNLLPRLTSASAKRVPSAVSLRSKKSSRSIRS